MSFKTVGQLKDEVSGLLTGLNLNNVVDLYGAFERTARQLIQKAYIPEATQRESKNLFSGVFDYTAPTNIFGGTLIDLRPQGEDRILTDVNYKRGIEVFDRSKGTLTNGYLVSFEYVNGVQRMRVANVKVKDRIVLDTMSDKTKWTFGGTQTANYTDETNYYKSPASIRFNQTAGTATLARTLDSKIDLTDYEGVGTVFLACYFPTVPTSITVRIGSNASNYFEVTETEGFLGAWTTNEWILTGFDLSGATETGTVDITKINYVQIQVTTGADVNNIRLGHIWVSLPSPHTVIYSSPAIFSASGTVSDTITNDNDEVLLQRNAYTIYEYECALSVAFQQGGKMSQPLIEVLRNILYGSGGNDLGLYGHYRSENPSEKLMQIDSWY